MSNAGQIPGALQTVKPVRPRAARRAARHAAAAAGLLACLLGVLGAARAGWSRLLSDYGSSTSLLAAAEEAVRLGPSDYQAHYARAVVLSDAGRHREAEAGLGRAVALRPEDYFFWLELGRSREEIEEVAGALAAYREAVRLAPHYAQPRWQLGNLLFRAGQNDEAFAELRLAAASDAQLFPAVADLAWGAYEGDAGAVLRATLPQTGAARLALARFFAARGEAAEATRLFREARADAGEAERHALTAELLGGGRFTEAYEVWSDGRTGGSIDGRAIFDGGFENGIPNDGPGFGWKPAPPAQTVRLALDAHEPRSGARSLRVEFSGDSDPTSPVVAQLALVEANARYRLTFAARAENLVMGGLPLVAIRDAEGGAPLFAQSGLLPTGTSGWRDYAVEFKTGATTRAVSISIQRLPCPAAPCPAFGRAWFDSFTLE